MSTPEGDDLLRHIRSYVRGRVPAPYEELVTELVGRTVVLVMTTPEFYNHLKAVQELQMENWRLRQALIALQPRTRKAPARKVPARKAPARKAPARKAPTKKAAPSNVRAFKKGTRGR